MKVKKSALKGDVPPSRKTIEWKLYSEASGLEDKLYKEKHGESRAETLIAIRKGKLSKIFQLVTWDKTFLYHPTIIPFILKAQVNEDKTFFRNLSNAVSKNSNSPLRKYEELVNWLELAVRDGIKTERELIRFCDIFSKKLNELPEGNPFSTLLDDKEELRKFLKRNRIRIFHSLNRG